MHQQKGKKILIYFFLLFIVGSINNISLNNLKLKKLIILILMGWKKTIMQFYYKKLKI